MVKSLFKYVLVFIISSTLYSCAFPSDEMELLDSSARSYEKAIRWGGFARAKSFHKNAPVISDLERRRLKFYRVTGYSILQHFTPDSFNSNVVVEIKYYKDNSAVIKTIIVEQHWKREKGSNVWYLDTPFPNFR